MAKKALLDVLEQTIGKYVKNLDAESLNVAVWSGKIELHSLELDVNAVNTELERQAAETPNLALPFKVISGKFDAFEVDVPWASLTSRPVVLRAHGLKVDVEPFDRLSQADYLQMVVASEAKRSEKIIKAREKSIETSDKYRKQANAMKKLAMGDDVSETKSTFSSRLVRRIIENMQIEISDVHVSLKNSDGAAGVVLESLSLVTTDKEGKKVFVDRTAEASFDNSFLYKKLLIEGFGIYLDDAFANAPRRLSSISESGNAEVGSPEHTFVLAPLSFQARLRQADSNICLDYAKYQLFSDLSSLSVILSRTQLDIARKISKEISSPSNASCPLFPEYRPLTRISKESAKDWWKYAVRCIGRLNGRSSWMEFFNAYRKRQRYIPLYRRHAHHQECPWITKLNGAELEELIMIEQDRSISVDGLMAWRNIADARVEKERQKHDAQNSHEESSGMFSSIFGTSKSKTTKNKQLNQDDPPIELTFEELKQLERMSKEDFSDPELSKDSKLCDVKFVLNALKINLIAYDLRNIAALQMGAVSVDFNAAADGAYVFDFNLLDLEIRDGATPNSLFPKVLCSVEKKTPTQKTRKKRGAFNLHLSKSKTGDQTLDLKLAEFQAIASQMFLRELKGFFSESKIKSSSKNLKQNPLLAQSISGSVDLFYDADEGDMSTMQPSLHAEPQGQTSTAVSDFSNLLVDAWKEKTQTKTAWTIDVDIDAPVVIVPERCNDANANVLVFDLGHLQFKYGKLDPAEKIKRWFSDNARPGIFDTILDSGTVSISELTFKVGKTGNLSKTLKSMVMLDSDSGNSSVIEPISILLDLGVESSGSYDRPRICCIGVIPSISLKLSPSQGSMAFPVVEAWREFADDFSDHGPQGEDINPTMGADEIPRSLESISGQQNVKTGDPNPVSEAAVNKMENHVTMYFMIGLQQLSVALAAEQSHPLEIHLVSVYASSTFFSDFSSISGLRMGWFWILDRLPYDGFPRRQRLLAHSNLPLSPEKLAEDDLYDIHKELRKQGVFERDFDGSTDLADISLKKVGIGGVESNNDDPPTGDEDGGVIDSVLNAKFSSLFIHWNPNAVKGVNTMIDTFVKVAFEHDMITDNNALIVPQTPDKSRAHRRPSVGQELPGSAEPSMKRTLIRAEMESLDIFLISAIDDYPLFAFTVSRTNVEILSDQSEDKALEASLRLGDLRVTTPGGMGRTLPSYRTLIGLAPGRSESLLTVKYFQGQRAVQRLKLGSVDTSQLEAFADVELSPMRLSYIHSQVLALTEFITEGILGVLTAQAASSAAEAAREISNSVVGGKLFHIKATSFDLVIPEAAYNDRALIVHAGYLNVEYSMLPDPGGAMVRASLSEVSLKDSLGNLMQEEKIRMSVNVRLPSDQVGSLDDRAMRVGIDISEASFVLSKAQYRQILKTLETNTGEIDLFLRDNNLSERPISELLTSPENENARLTHAGTLTIDYVRRMYITLNVEVLALQLCNSITDPLVRVAAVNARVHFSKIPDDERIACKVSLRNFVCEDCRTKARGSQYRFLVDQSDDLGTLKGNENENLFNISYSSDVRGSSIDLKVGSPQVVLIPDAISAISAFFQSEGISGNDNKSQSVLPETPPLSKGQQIVHVASTLSGEDIETTLVDKEQSDTNLSLTEISVATRVCKIVLVDLGSQLSSSIVQSSPPSLGIQAQLTETMVLQGAFSASLSLDSDTVSGRLVNAEFQGQGDDMEIFSAFGREMKSPLQILEPSEGSAHGSLKSRKDGSSEIEVRAAALTPFEFIISTHNAALLSAILNSLSESFSSSESLVTADESENNILSEEEAKRIEQLASALASPRQHGSIPQSESSNIDDSSVALSAVDPDQGRATRKIQIKLTMPELNVSVVNDLQGLDEALFRISVINFVAGSEVNFGNTQTSTQMTFDFHLNTSVLADYFDASMNAWNKLLVKPWELTLKGIRAPTRRNKANRLSTAIDLESFPCWISFSEQFLVSLASAYRMWSIYSAATALADDDLEASYRGMNSASVRHSMAASAARNLVTSLPYAIDNHSGEEVSFSLPGGSIDHRPCPYGKMHYFRFDPPKGRGSAGKRSYGQDVEYDKAVSIFIRESIIEIGHLDAELGLPRRAHQLPGGHVLMTQVVKEGKTTVLHLASFVGIRNLTSFPFSISGALEGNTAQIGVCFPDKKRNSENAALRTTSEGVTSRDSTSFSLPISYLAKFEDDWVNKGEARVVISISPNPPTSMVESGSVQLLGTIDFSVSLLELKKSNGNYLTRKIDVTCRSHPDIVRSLDPLVVQVQLKMILGGNLHPYVEVTLEPRAIIENKIPVGIQIRTPMPHTFSSSSHSIIGKKDSLYNLNPGERIEVFTPGPSIAITLRISEKPVAGSALDWLEEGWIDLPLVSEFQLLEPISCLLPFSNDDSVAQVGYGATGSEFYIVEGYESLAELGVTENEEAAETKQATLQSKPQKKQRAPNNSSLQRIFFVTVRHYGVDHTGDILFEQVSESDRDLLSGSFSDMSKGATRRGKVSRPFSAFASERHRRRISLLPAGSVPIRLLQLTMEQDIGLKRSMPFFLEELPLGEGGVETIPIHWENKKPTGYFAYRTIVNEHQSEIHVVPEFIVFNGSQNAVLVKERGKPEILIDAGKVSQLRIDSRLNGLDLAFSFFEMECSSGFVSVGDLGLKVAILNSRAGYPIGSVCVQTVIDTHGDARLVVKIGEMVTGAVEAGGGGAQRSMFSDDFFRFRLRWTELQLILNETQELSSSNWTASEGVSRASKAIVSALSGSPRNVTRNKTLEGAGALQPVAAIIFSRFTFDYQRVFKESTGPRDSMLSPERSQVSLIVHNVQIKDLTPDSPFPVVFDCTSNSSFIDLCIRIRGPMDVDLVTVDLFDLNLAYGNKKSEKMILTTSEDFVWKILDLINRILAASGEFAGISLRLEEDEKHGGYVVKLQDSRKAEMENEQQYTPPKGDRLYDVTLARVSPISLLVTFRRNPNASRYQKVRNVRGASLTNYFTRRLKFTIDKAELNFARYEDRSLKGPPDRLVENLCAVYLSRMKFKLVTLLSAATLQDWKYLAARDTGDDDYVEGDILRVTGNLAGKSAALVFNKVGTGLGAGVSGITRAVGSGIEKSTKKIGAGRVGAGLNDVVTGVGDGVGDTLSGVGSGAGKVFKGVGQGVGHVFGGVAGGAFQVGKGIGKGITTGDGKAVVEGFAQGANSLGGGIAQGAESAVMGAADGFLSAGRGLVSGVKSVGRGLGGAITGKRPEKKPEKKGWR